MFRYFLLCALLLGSGGWLGIAQAQQYVYKWTDEQGQLKYSALPPPTGVAYEMVQKSGATNKPESETKDLAKEQEELKLQLEQEGTKAQEEQQRIAQARAKNCEVARKNAQVLESDRPVVRTNAEGKKVLLEGEARQAELQKAKKDLDYFCSHE